MVHNYMGGRNWRFPRYEAVHQGQVVNNVIYGWTSDGIRIGTPATPDLRMNLEWINNYQTRFAGALIPMPGMPAPTAMATSTSKSTSMDPDQTEFGTGPATSGDRRSPNPD